MTPTVTLTRPTGMNKLSKKRTSETWRISQTNQESLQKESLLLQRSLLRESLPTLKSSLRTLRCLSNNWSSLNQLGCIPTPTPTVFLTVTATPTTTPTLSAQVSLTTPIVSPTTTAAPEILTFAADETVIVARSEACVRLYWQLQGEIEQVRLNSVTQSTQAGMWNWVTKPQTEKENYKYKNN